MLFQEKQTLMIFLWAHIFPHFTANLMKKKQTKQKHRSINTGVSLKRVTTEKEDMNLLYLK